MFWQVSEVSAQESTPTPTATPPNYYTPDPDPDPIFNTPTPRGITDYGCPEGDPIGWMTVTPDPVWLFNCGHCVDQGTGYDWGSTPEGWDDYPEGWETATPNATPTVEYLGDPSNAKFEWQGGGDNLLEDGVTQSYNYSGNRFDYIGGGGWTNAIEEGATGYKVTFLFEHIIDFTGGSSLYEGIDVTFGMWFLNKRPGQTVILTFNPGGGSEFDITLAYNESYQVNLVSGPVVQDHYLEIDQWVNIEVIDPDQTAYMDVQFGTSDHQFITGYLDYDLDITWWGYPNSPIVPDPTPTPPVTDCSEVVPIGEGGEEDDQFSIPDIFFGSTSCFTIGGFEIPLDWLNIFFGGDPVSNWYVPGVQFCFQALHFGDLSLFGLAIDLDWIALGMAGVVLFRFFTRS